MASSTTSSTTRAPSDLRDQISSLLSTLPNAESVTPGVEPCPLPSDLASIIDHTLLAPQSTEDDIRRVVSEAVELGAGTFCINPSMLRVAVDHLQKQQQQQEFKPQPLPICVVSFPFGSSPTRAKAAETTQAIEDGAREIDMVQNVGWIRSEQWEKCYDDVRAVVDAAQDAPVKVILETAHLTWEQVAISTLIACLAGAAFVKTSTGYASAGAQPEHIKLMSFIAQPRGVKVKASGGIRDLEKVQLMWQCGARRVGASGTRSILEQYKRGGGTAAAAGSDGY